jgi:phosphoenolpyruvate carboxykinase (ATP)
MDGFAGWDPRYRIKVRVICARPYHALFMWNMLIRPTSTELAMFGEPDYVIYNAGQFPANRHTTGMTSKTSVDISFETKAIMNYLMPKQGHLSMPCSVTGAPATDRSSVLFGLSGTGKTTPSADPKRKLVGDDEHVWTDEGVFNIEGGCYAKAIALSAEREPEIWAAIRFGAVMENVVFDDDDHEVDFHDTSVTQNTRVAYPIDYIGSAKIPCVVGHPTDVIFLTCDAFGVLPPVSRLTAAQAMYHFISGYTAKVAGTEIGVTEPEATFSACFGAPFLVWHPAKYAELLAEKIAKHDVNVWLVNTGWSGGAYGVGHRIDLGHTRAIIDAIHAGELAEAPTQEDPVFGLQVVTIVKGVPSGILVPRDTWADPESYDVTARKLADLFANNFETSFADGVTEDVRNAGPRPTGSPATH